MSASASGGQASLHGRVLKIALPIVLSNATIPILGAVDTAVVGQMGAAAPIGAVGLGAVILSAIYWIFGFLRMGTTGLAAQAEGQGDRAEVAALLTRAMMIGLAGGLAVIVLQPLLFAGAFTLAPASAEVEGLARGYMGIRVWSAPAAIAIYGITGWLIARERAGAVLALQLWMNGVNVGLDLWFVLGLGWGVNGVAAATFLAEWSALGVGLWLCRAAFAVPDWRDRARVFDRLRLRRMAQVNTDILIRSLFLQSIFLSFMFYASGFGDVPLAATQVLVQFVQVTAFALDGFAFAAEAMVGRAMGARSVATLRRAALVASFWGGVASVVLAAGFWIFGPWIIDVMADVESVQVEARRYLPWMVAVPMLGLASWMLDGVFIGATRTADMRNMTALAVVLYFASLGVLMPVFGMHGVWAALALSYLFRAGTLLARYPALERAAA